MATDETTSRSSSQDRAEKSSVFSHSFSTTWRKALVSLPRIVPSAVTSHYMGHDGPKPFVLKLPSGPPHDHSIPVHIFLQLPPTEDTPPESTPSSSRARSAGGSSPRPGGISGTATPTSARARSVHEIEKPRPSSSHGTPTTTGANTPTSSTTLSPAAAAARRSFEATPLSSPSTTSSSISRPGPKPNQLHPTSRRHRKPTLSLPVLIDFHGGSFILGSPSEQAPFCAYMAQALSSAPSSSNNGSETPVPKDGQVSTSINDRGRGCVVISVDYRLGPYATFPAANEDADDVVRAVLDADSPGGRVLREDIRQHAAAMGFGKQRKDKDKEKDKEKRGRSPSVAAPAITTNGGAEWLDLDTTRVAVSGFSSGGNLALNCVVDSPQDPNHGGKDWDAVFPRGRFRWPLPVVLFYPSFDARLLPDERPRPEGLDPPTGFFARWKIEDELMPKYLPISRRGDVRASPGLASIKDHLHPQAKIFLVLPELDSLSDQSQQWVSKVRDAGREEDLEVVHVKGEMHGWTQFPDQWIKTEESRRRKYECFERAAEWVGRWWYAVPERVSGTVFGGLDGGKR